MKRILFIGRFQPFHKGHFSIIKKALKNADELIIGIGSAENAYEEKNPFTTHERMEMILRVLYAEKAPLDRIHIIPIRDIHNDSAWVSHVQSLTPTFSEVYTGQNEGYLFNKKLFEQEGIPVRVQDHEYNIEASNIRNKILVGEDYKQDLHEKALEYFLSINGEKRIIDSCRK